MIDGGGKDVPQNDIGKGEKSSAHTSESEKSELAGSIVDFGKYFVTRYPQADLGMPVRFPAPRLNYTFAGSLSTLLFSQADSFTPITVDDASGIREQEAREIPTETREGLKPLIRQIGDVDVVQTPAYKDKRSRISRLFGEELRAARQGVILVGNEFKYDDIPDNAKSAVKVKDMEKPILVDPAHTYGQQNFAQITVDGSQFFISSPEDFVPYKVLNMLDKHYFYDISPEKFGSEFLTLHDAMRGLYTEEALVSRTAELIRSYDAHMIEATAGMDVKRVEASTSPGMFAALLAKPSLPQEAKSFLGKVHASQQPSA